MKADHNIADELLVKYLLGEASATEQVQVQRWMGESEANKKQFYHFKLLWDESRNVAAVSTVNENEAWNRFKARTAAAPQRRTIALPQRWLKVAAAVLLLAGGGWLAWFMAGPDAAETTEIAAQRPAEPPVNKQFPVSSDVEYVPTEVTTVQKPDVVARTVSRSVVGTASVKTVVGSGMAANGGTRFIAAAYEDKSYQTSRTKEFICNATPCPLEICIVQSIKCQNGTPAAISTCSVLEPDEAGQLHYKGVDKMTNNCNAVIEEIRIKRTTTGETIVLNADSKPATAQDFFNYITGQKKGDIVAGVFLTDCNSQSDNCGLTFDNNIGHLILQ